MKITAAIVLISIVLLFTNCKRSKQLPINVKIELKFVNVIYTVPDFNLNNMVFKTTAAIIPILVVKNLGKSFLDTRRDSLSFFYSNNKKTNFIRCPIDSINLIIKPKDSSNITLDTLMRFDLFYNDSLSFKDSIEKVMDTNLKDSKFYAIIKANDVTDTIIISPSKTISFLFKPTNYFIKKYRNGIH